MLFVCSQNFHELWLKLEQCITRKDMHVWSRIWNGVDDSTREALANATECGWETLLWVSLAYGKHCERGIQDQMALDLLRVMNPTLLR